MRQTDRCAPRGPTTSSSRTQVRPPHSGQATLVAIQGRMHGGSARTPDPDGRFGAARWRHPAPGPSARRCSRTSPLVPCGPRARPPGRGDRHVGRGAWGCRGPPDHRRDGWRSAFSEPAMRRCWCRDEPDGPSHGPRSQPSFSGWRRARAVPAVRAWHGCAATSWWWPAPAHRCASPRPARRGRRAGPARTAATRHPSGGPWRPGCSRSRCTVARPRPPMARRSLVG